MAPLAEQTTTIASETLDDAEVAVLPTGSTEQHGPALPLGTDSMTAETLAATVEDREDAVVLPTVPVGVSEHHRQFDGTLWVTPETFERYVTETLESVASHGVEKAVLVNGHGGNADALSRAARTVRADETMFAAPWNWWDSVGELTEELFDGVGGHAGEMESSMMLRVREELVHEEQLADAEADGGESWGKTVHGANVGFDTLDFSESGAVGTPTDGSREAGEALFDRATEQLDGLVGWLADQSFDELRARPHK